MLADTRPGSPAPDAPPRGPGVQDAVDSPIRRLPPRQVDVDASLPDGMALIKVTTRRVGSWRGYSIKAYCGGVDPLRSAPPTPHEDLVRLVHLRRNDAIPSELFHTIEDWSEGHEELTDWINEARAVHGEDLQVMIWDDTGYEMPWEVLSVPPGGPAAEPGGLLGALVVMSRWTQVRRHDRGLPREPDRCRGAVLGYYGPEHIADEDLFESYAHTPHRQVERFFEELGGPRDDLGLVYVGCHGDHGTGRSDLKLAGKTYYDIKSVDMAAIRRSNAMVWLNACDSGLFHTTEGLDPHDDVLRGFAELFLRKGAACCVVTAGVVSDRDAHALAARLAKEMAGEAGHRVNELLRDFRRRAVEEFGSLRSMPYSTDAHGDPNGEAQQRVRVLLRAFMFHSYGHPHTSLALTGRRPGPAPEEGAA